MEGVQSWISKHKLTSIVWASAIGASLAYSRSKTPFKPSLRLIHARMHAQALTLAVLSGAAVYQYYEKRGNEH
ncbi:induced by hypoxia [Olea europaea subsp. europaea]|uniref:Induced by hypoxia n=1 Tax=Olea europaea subsp. europaea TaxID=158383 RepID=A0A8S0PGI8_OLEEU|nr:induced by hypoxia [Olea europaea subsp. europaea]